MKISVYDTQDFSWKKKTQSTRFRRGKKLILNHQNCMIISRQVGTTKIKGLDFFKKKLSYAVYSQIWLNDFLDDSHFDYLSIKERNPGRARVLQHRRPERVSRATEAATAEALPESRLPRLQPASLFLLDVCVLPSFPCTSSSSSSNQAG